MSIRFPLTTVAILTSLSCLAESTPTATSPDAVNKADYTFFESSRKTSDEDPASAFELLRKAADIMPESPDLGFMYGLQLMSIARNDSTLFTKGYDLADRYFNSGATDYYNLFTFGQINDHIGNIDKSIAIWERLDSIYPTKYNATLKLAERLTQTGDSANISRAMGLYDRLETANGKNIAVTYRKMNTYMMQGDTASVINEIRALIESAPLNSEYTLMAADLYASFNNPDSAMTYYNRAVNLDPNSGMAIYRRANFYLSQGDSTAYRSEIREAMRHESLDSDTKLELMAGFVRDSYTDPSQRANIEELFDEIIAQNPREAAIRDLYSSYLHAIENYKGAAEQTEYAVDVDPSDETRWRNLVGLYITTADYDKAADAATRALHYFPESDDFITTIGTSKLIAGDIKGAEDYFVDLLARTDTTKTDLMGYILTQLGDIANNASERDKAIGFYERARKYIPNNPLLLNNYAYLLAETDSNLDEAEKMSAESLLSRPDEPTYLDTYAWILFKKKDFKSARTMIDKAMENSEQPAPDILEHAGDIYFFLGETTDALSFWEKAFELNPDSDTLKTKVKTRAYPIK